MLSHRSAALHSNGRHAAWKQGDRDLVVAVHVSSLTPGPVRTCLHTHDVECARTCRAWLQVPLYSVCFRDVWRRVMLGVCCARVQYRSLYSGISKRCDFTRDLRTVAGYSSSRRCGDFSNLIPRQIFRGRLCFVAGFRGCSDNSLGAASFQASNIPVGDLEILQSMPIPVHHGIYRLPRQHASVPCCSCTMEQQRKTAAEVVDACRLTALSLDNKCPALSQFSQGSCIPSCKATSMLRPLSRSILNTQDSSAVTQRLYAVSLGELKNSMSRILAGNTRPDR